MDRDMMEWPGFILARLKMRSYLARVRHRDSAQNVTQKVATKSV
jgi:hypothetical protein